MINCHEASNWTDIDIIGKAMDRYVVIFVTVILAATFPALVAAADKPIPHKPQDDGSGKVVVTGVLQSEPPTGRPCVYRDYTKATIDDKTHALPVWVIPEVSGLCTDASMQLPAGWQPTEVLIKIIRDEKKPLNCKIYKTTSGGETCIVETIGKNGKLGYVSQRSLDCRLVRYRCGATPVLVDVNMPKEVCRNVGDKFRALHTYFEASPVDQGATFKIEVMMNRCAGGGGFEGN